MLFQKKKKKKKKHFGDQSTLKSFLSNALINKHFKINVIVVIIQRVMDHWVLAYLGWLDNFQVGLPRIGLVK